MYSFWEIEKKIDEYHKNTPSYSFRAGHFHFNQIFNKNMD